MLFIHLAKLFSSLQDNRKSKESNRNQNCVLALVLSFTVAWAHVTYCFIIFTGHITQPVYVNNKDEMK